MPSRTPDMPAQEYDVVVAGGGPAGASAATICAQEGASVLLLERSQEPHFKVGESLMPATYWTLERLGVLEEMKRSAFPKKFSVQFFSPGGRASTPFYFRDNDPHESSQTWQVLRSDFDQMLLENAIAKGVDVRRGVSVKEILFANTRATGIRFREHDGRQHELGCRVFVDATGQSAILGRQLGAVEMNPCLKHASLFTHYEGGRRDEGIDEGATLIFHTDEKRSWFWFIPLPGNRVSVGVVGSIDHLIRDRVGDPQRVFAEELDSCPALAERLESARQVMPVRALRDFSYRMKAGAGDGWVLVGDAGGFIDPIYSSGVFLALTSGEMAADAITAALAAGDLSAARLGAFLPRYLKGVDALRQLVYAFYDPRFSFARFLRRHPECRSGLVHLLVGNVYRERVEHVLDALAEELAWERPIEAST